MGGTAACIWTWALVCRVDIVLLCAISFSEFVKFQIEHVLSYKSNISHIQCTCIIQNVQILHTDKLALVKPKYSPI